MKNFLDSLSKQVLYLYRDIRLVRSFRQYLVSVFAIIFVLNSSAYGSSKIGIHSSDVSSDMSSEKPVNYLAKVNVAKALGWVKTCEDCNNLCDGYFYESENFTNNPQPAGFADTPMNVKASKPAFFTKAGASIIQGDVKLTQPGREITADQATFFRDSSTGKIQKSILIGHVNFHEPNQLTVSEQGSLDFSNKIYVLHNGLYRLLTDTPTGLHYVWGRAKEAINKAKGVLVLKKATYSSCEPDHPSWSLWGNDVDLNRNTGRAAVTHAVFYLKNMPVFYLPYLNFAIDKRRKSGFLTPTPTYSKDSGFGLDIPYYLNLAPNFDLTLTPRFFTNRGVLISGMYRYLTATSFGSMNINYTPYDSAFVKFRDVNKKLTGVDQHALKSLQESNDGRGLISIQNDSRFSENWKSSIRVNYASDDYFLQDYGNLATTTDTDQLLNQVDLNYTDYHWDFLARLQMLQTLHTLTNVGVQDKYKRLPQLNLSGDFEQGWGGLDYGLESELVNFMHRDDFYETHNLDTIISGTRLNIAPSISLPLAWLGGYITPKTQLRVIGYDTFRKLNPSLRHNFIRTIPLFSIDSGVVFRREINFLHKKYSQTLEPRLFYLFVPKVDQNEMPVFDTYLPAFDYNQLFRNNRFSGVDRVGDANQISFGIVSRFLDQEGQEKLNIALGQVVSLHKHEVELKNDSTFDPLKNEILSPTVGQLQYFIIPKVNVSLSSAWDPNYQRFNTFEANVQYLDGPNRVINLCHRYVIQKDQDPLTKKTLDFNQILFSTGWKLFNKWHIIGGLNYNLSYKRAQNYLYGLEYNSCCFAMRIVHNRTFIGVDNNNNKSYDSRIYFQLLLKGFNNFDYGGLESVLASQVGGYHTRLQ
jgi:LPS-assembly protein